MPTNSTNWEMVREAREMRSNQKFDIREVERKLERERPEGHLVYLAYRLQILRPAAYELARYRGSWLAARHNPDELPHVCRLVEEWEAENGPLEEWNWQELVEIARRIKEHERR